MQRRDETHAIFVMQDGCILLFEFPIGVIDEHQYAWTNGIILEEEIHFLLIASLLQMLNELLCGHLLLSKVQLE